MATFTFQHFPHLGADSLTAAIGSECAADQGMFFSYYDAVYQRESPGVSRALLDKVARDIGLELEAFASCVNGRVHEAEVLRVYDEARQAGVEGTPTVFLNGDVYPLGTVDDFLRDVRALAGGDE